MGIICAGSTEPPVLAHQNGDFRLVVDSEDSLSGRFEYLHDGVWGTWCDDVADQNNFGAQAACKTLGLPWTEATHFDVTGPETSPIYFDNVACTGNENSIMDCPMNDIGAHNCVHSEDMGITCAGESIFAYVHGNYRLVHDGSTCDPASGVCSGRFEMIHNGEWGTWCDDIADQDNLSA